ncbi:MAG: hypothetical protein K6G85_07660 [Eubacterium sp.]|nr:hypothetical protein [Eubacterium sp.]
MIINVKKLAKILKTNYMSFGIKLFNHNGALIIEGTNFSAMFYGDEIPKEVLGEVIKLSGRIPCEGAGIKCSTGGNEDIEFQVNQKLWDTQHLFWQETIMKVSDGNRDYRIFEAADRTKHLVQTSLLELLDEKEILKKEVNGDEIYKRYCESKQNDRILWQDRDSTLMINPIVIDEYNNLLDELKNVTIPFKDVN